MAKSISIEVPHHLTQDQARARIADGIDKAVESHGNKVSSVSHNWDGNKLAFAVKAMGQSLSGTADVLPQSVKINVDLPWALAMFGGKLKDRMETEVRGALEDKT